MKFILPALTEATSPLFRPVKYSQFPPLGLATLAGYLDSHDQVVIMDEHVEPLRLDDQQDLVAIEVYITSACRGYAIAGDYRRRDVFVVLGGLHVTSLPSEAAQHADVVFTGPGEDTWPLGVSERRMLPAVAEGGTDPVAVAALADPKLRATPEQWSSCATSWQPVIICRRSIAGCCR